MAAMAAMGFSGVNTLGPQSQAVSSCVHRRRVGTKFKSCGFVLWKDMSEMEHTHELDMFKSFEQVSWVQSEMRFQTMWWTLVDIFLLKMSEKSTYHKADLTQVTSGYHQCVDRKGEASRESRLLRTVAALGNLENMSSSLPRRIKHHQRRRILRMAQPATRTCLATCVYIYIITYSESVFLRTTP